MTLHEIALRAIVTLIVAAGAVMAQTGGGATLVGTVKDATGAAVGAAKVTVVNIATSFIAETTTSPEGAYYVPYLAPGDYRMKVSSAGFKEFVREGITLRSAEVPRVDITLELGSISESVTVSASASLLSTENVVSAYVLPADVLVETPGVMKRTVYLLQYMPGWSAWSARLAFTFKDRPRMTSASRSTESAPSHPIPASSTRWME
jgi:hypothetical protein